MAEADIDTIIGTTPDGDTNWGTDLRGAMTTLKTRVKPLADQYAMTHSASGALTINWANGVHFRVSSNAFNITGLNQTNAPTGNTIYSGTLEVKNTSSTASIVVDLTGLTHGLDTPVTIPANSSDLFLIWSTGT